MTTTPVFPARVSGLYRSRFAQVVVGLLLGIALGVLTPERVATVTGQPLHPVTGHA